MTNTNQSELLFPYFELRDRIVSYLAAQEAGWSAENVELHMHLGGVQSLIDYTETNARKAEPKSGLFYAWEKSRVNFIDQAMHELASCIESNPKYRKDEDLMDIYAACKPDFPDNKVREAIDIKPNIE